MMLLGVDVSSHQYPPDAKTPPNYDAMKASGLVEFVVAKASEGTGYRNPNLARDRAEAHRLGMGFGMYHFARAGHPLEEADYFVDTFGALKSGEFLWLDWEVDALNPPVWARTFLDHLLFRTTVRGVVYLNRSRLTGSDWKPVVSANYGLAVATYDNNPGALPNPAPWPVPAFKQFTDEGVIPGISVPVDRLVFYGSRASLDKYGYQAPAPKPVPVPAPRPVPVPPKPAPKPVPVPNGPASLPTLKAGDKGEVIGKLQLFLNKNYPAYSNIVVTRWYGPSTITVVRDFQHRSGITTPDADGTIIGPKTNAALWAAGWRG